MRLAVFFLSLVLMLAGAARAAEDGITTFRLKNGLQVVVVEDHRAPIVVQMIWYRIGAADEKPGKSGIAHLLEHLMFKGTKAYGPGEFSRIVAANGGSENAFTSYDYTAYWQRVAADRLPMLMAMESDRMKNLILSEGDVRTERSVVLEERNERVETSPGALLTEQRMAALYLNHPYGIPIIGWRHEVAALARTDALAFYRTYYAPNNAILVIAGDAEPGRVRSLAERYYGSIRPTPGLAARRRPSEPPQIAERRVTLADSRVSRAYMIRTYLAPERNHVDQREAAALTLLAEILGGSDLTSFLGERLVLDEKKALDIGAFYDGLSLDRTSFGLFAMPAAGVSLSQVEDALDAALNAFLKSGIDEDQLARIKMQVKAARIYGRDATQSRARAIGEALSSGLTLDDLRAWPAVLRSIRPDEIMAAAHRVFDRRHAVTARLRKSRDEEAAK